MQNKLRNFFTRSASMRRRRRRKFVSPSSNINNNQNSFVDLNSNTNEPRAYNKNKEKDKIDYEAISEPVKFDKEIEENKEEIQQNNHKRELVKGASWLSLGSIVSRILGALYIIPWTALLGSMYMEANNLFTKGYTIYALFLMLSTAGIPTAIANLVSRYNALEEGKISLQILKNSLKMAVFLGLFFSLTLYFGASFIDGGDSRLVPVLHSLAPAVFLFPFISMFRGFFQGNQIMSVSAISQMIEQVVRIIYMLVASAIILKIDSNDWQGVVVQSTFAAFIGSIFSLLVLTFSFAKRRKLFFRRARKSKGNVSLKNKKMMFNIFKQAIPFIVIGSAITVYQLIDQYSFYPIMKHFFLFNRSQIDMQLGRFNANVNKLMMIIAPFSASIAASSLPMLSKSYALKNMENIRKQLITIYRLFILVTPFLALGVYAVSKPLYIFFYGNYDNNLNLAVYLLQFAAILSIIFGLFSVLTMSLQGMEITNVPLRALYLGIIVKLSLQVPMVFIFQSMGAMIATFIGFSVSNILMLSYIKKIFSISIMELLPDMAKSLTLSLSSAIPMIIISSISESFMPYTRFSQLIVLIVAALIGMIFPIIYLKKTHFDYDLIGRSLPNFMKK